MAPKQQRIASRNDVSRRPAKSYISNAYETITSPENASVVRSVAIFGVSSEIYLQLEYGVLPG